MCAQQTLTDQHKTHRCLGGGLWTYRSSLVFQSDTCLSRAYSYNGTYGITYQLCFSSGTRNNCLGNAPLAGTEKKKSWYLKSFSTWDGLWFSTPVTCHCLWKMQRPEIYLSCACIMEVKTFPNKHTGFSESCPVCSAPSKQNPGLCSAFSQHAFKLVASWIVFSDWRRGRGFKLPSFLIPW